MEKKIKTALLIGCVIWAAAGCVNLRKQPMGFSIAPATHSFVLIDAGLTATPALVLKKKRVGVVKDVKNQYLVMVSRELQHNFRLVPVVDTGLSVDDREKLIHRDKALIQQLQQRYPASILLILRACGGGFSKSSSHKVAGGRVVEYATFFDTDWIIVHEQQVEKKMVTITSPHSTGGTFQLELRGPGYAANKDDIIEAAEKNALKFAGLFSY